MVECIATSWNVPMIASSSGVYGVEIYCSWYVSASALVCASDNQCCARDGVASRLPKWLSNFFPWPYIHLLFVGVCTKLSWSAWSGSLCSGANNIFIFHFDISAGGVYWLLLALFIVVFFGRVHQRSIWPWATFHQGDLSMVMATNTINHNTSWGHLTTTHITRWCLHLSKNPHQKRHLKLHHMTGGFLRVRLIMQEVLWLTQDYFTQQKNFHIVLH